MPPPLALLLMQLLLLAGVCAGAGARGPQCAAGAACRANSSVIDDYIFTVEGKKLIVSYTERDSYMLTCPDNLTLDSAALPRLRPPVRVARVKLRACAEPRAGLPRALAALGVLPAHSLELWDVPGPVSAPLRVPPVRNLLLAAAPAAPAAAPPAPGLLAALPAELRELRLTGVPLAPEDLLALPAALEALWLQGAGLREVPRAALERLPALRHLSLREPRLAAAPELAAAPALRAAELHAPLAALAPGPALVNLTLCDVRDAAPRGPCDALERLTVCRAALLPAGALAPCPRLAELVLDALPAGAVAAGALRGAHALRVLRVRRSGALELPPALLADAPALRVLDLSFNSLRSLPSDLFGAPLQLEELNLEGNRLPARALDALTPFRALRRLELTSNPLGDLCGSTASYLSNDLSPLREMRALRHLRLGHAQITRVCRDWREQLRDLAALDLSYNRIPELQYEDLRWGRAGGTLDVDLRGNPISTVRYSKEDYDRAAVATAAPGATLQLDARLTCDCRVYWFARALRERPQHAPAGVAELRCSGRAERLRAVPPAALACPVPAAACAPACACTLRGADLELRCERAGLAELPRAPPPLPPPRQLHAAGNRISTLPRDALPPELQLLDLRDNLIEELDVESVGALFEASERRVLLAGNPLRCGCAQRASLAALQAHQARLRDAANVTCADGRALLALRPAALCGAALDALPAALAALGALALLLALAALACLARPSARRRIKRFLLERDLCLRLVLRAADAHEEDDGPEARAYDAFVSYSHRDEEFVRRLAARLEGGARPRRLCLHYRDWPPGEWIPAQIAASVRASRRTLAVVSEHFLRSAWARAEFREAHAAALRDARPRLVVLLLGEPPEPLLDAELRSFLAANTYLRWGDPWFWDKLLHALPLARRHPAAPAPAPAPAPAAA